MERLRGHRSGVPPSVNRSLRERSAADVASVPCRLVATVASWDLSPLPKAANELALGAQSAAPAHAVPRRRSRSSVTATTMMMPMMMSWLALGMSGVDTAVLQDRT